MKTAVLQK